MDDNILHNLVYGTRLVISSRENSNNDCENTRYPLRFCINKLFKRNADVAQLVEQLIRNQ
jgi:hypothetical protein